MKKLSGNLLTCLFLSLVFSGLSTFTYAQIDQATLDERIDKLFSAWDKPESPGAALAVVRNGEIIYKKGYGSAQLEYNIPLSPSTIFHVASVSKQFTAFSITMLADQGKLSLEDDIRKHLPEVPDFGETVTIRHLIHHISGIRDQWELLAMAGWRLDDVITKEHIMKMVMHQRELNFAPGEKYLYCNTGFTLLAVIVEKVTGKSFREWTAENIFQPLEMNDTHFHDDHEMIVKNRAYSYSPVRKSGFKKRVLSYANVGATSLFTTVEDLAKWINNFTHAKAGGKKVIEQMQQQGILNNGEKIGYAHGLGIGEYKGLKTVGHGGADAGFRSIIRMFPEQKFAIVILSNLGSFNTGLLANRVTDIFLEKEFSEEEQEKESEEEETITVESGVLDKYKGKYMLETNTEVTISKVNNRLMWSAERSSRYRLYPQSDKRFFLKVADAYVIFHQENDGKVNTFTFQETDEELKATRIDEESLKMVSLEDFTGEYYSEELGTAYKLVLEDGKLIAKHRRHSDIPLTMKDIDNFRGTQWFFRKIKFSRDENNNVKGFWLTGGRVRNMRFEKIER